MKANLNLKRDRFSIKLLPLLAGVISLTLSAMSIAPAFAQSSAPTAPTTERTHGHWKNKLNLTAEQEQKMKQIRQASREQIDSILTPDQKAQLKAAKADQKNHHRGFASLNLSADQRTRIQAVMSASKQQMDAILTPEQRQQMEQMHQQRQQHHRQAPAAGTQAPN